MCFELYSSVSPGATAAPTMPGKVKFGGDVASKR